MLTGFCQVNSSFLPLFHFRTSSSPAWTPTTASLTSLPLIPAMFWNTYYRDPSRFSFPWLCRSLASKPSIAPTCLTYHTVNRIIIMKLILIVICFVSSYYMPGTRLSMLYAQSHFSKHFITKIFKHTQKEKE